MRSRNALQGASITNIKHKAMKTIKKRFSTLELVEYRMSNSTRIVYFDTLEEATQFAFEQKRLHPRSKKITGYVFDSVEKKSIRVAF